MKLNGRASGARLRCRAWMALGLLLVTGSLAVRLGSRVEDPQVAESNSASPSSFIDQAQTALSSSSAQRNARAFLGQLPLSFEPNQGQTDSQVRFLARGTGYGLFLAADEAVLKLRAGLRRGARRNAGVGPACFGGFATAAPGIQSHSRPGRTGRLIDGLRAVARQLIEKHTRHGIQRLSPELA